MKNKLLYLLCFILFSIPRVSFGQAPNLGTTSTFALYTAGGAISNVGSTVIKGDIGTNAGAFTGFPPGIVNGQTHIADGAAAQALTDVGVAYSNLSSFACGSNIGVTLGNNQTLSPGVYCTTAASTINGNLVLNGGGNPNAVFIFKIGGALSTSTLSSISLTNGASLCNVFWQVNGAVSLGVTSVFRGTIVANGAISLLQNATLIGRGLSTAGAINLNSNVVDVALKPVVPVITASGALTFCIGGSVVLSGNNNGGVWSTGATSPSITVSTSGTYSVTNTTNCGSSTASVVVTVIPSSSCLITGSSTICQGQTTQLCVPAGSASYSWSTGATTNCITVSAAGTYTVNVKDVNGCQSTCSKTVTVATPPACLITGSNTICQGQTTQLCVPTGSASYSWNTGATTNCITVSAAGTYTVNVTDANGCQSTCSKTVTVTIPPACLITGNLSLCLGQTTQLCVAAGFASYLWSNGATTNCITVNAAGTYSVRVTDANGCVSNCSAIISVGAQSTCLITGNGNICQGQTTQLCVPAGSASYKWSTGETTNCITVSASGNYSVTVTEGGGCTSICNKIVTVNPIPACLITGNLSLCFGQTTQLCVAAGFSSYLWSNGATTNCITVNAAGTYSVRVTDANGCVSNCSAIVSVGLQSTCLITGNGNICQGQTTQLCVPAGSTSYKWSTGETTNCITVSATGNYSVTVTEGGGCTSICNKIVTVNPIPACLIRGNLSLCFGQTTQLCVAAGFSSYLWSNGATTNCITVNSAGTYSVRVTDANGCVSNCSANVTIGLQASCLITGNGNICQGQTTQLCVPAGSASYKWSTGEITNCITVNATGNYSVTVTEVGGCISICNKIVTANQPPICTITGGSSLCNGQSIQLCTPLSATATYLWSTGAITNCINVNAAGTYSVTVTEGGCQSVCSKIITANQPPICTITGGSSLCDGQSIQLCTPLSATATYLWSTGAITNCINVNAAGTYSVTVTEGGCQSVCSKIVTANQPPICTITGGSSLCNGQSIQLCTPLSATATYLWSTGAITNCINVNAAGTYSVTVTEGGCQSVCSKIITANQPPICTITGGSSLCNGQSIQLCTPLSATATYLWSTGATTNCINLNTAGTYSVTVTEGGCQSICSKIITANQPPICTITGGSSLCNGQSIQLCTPLSATATYLWNTGATTNCINVNTAGTYSVTVTEGGCQSVCSKIITNNQPSTCTITGGNSLCNGQSIQLCTPLSATATYLWSTGATTNCINVNTAGTYSVTVTEGGCQSICSKIITTNQPSTCTITGGNSLCNGQSIQLCTPLSATATYLWSTGATTNCINVNTAGTYSVTVTEGGCQSVCSKNIIMSQPPICTITGKSSLCGRQSIQLCTPLSATATYLWSTGATTNCITVNIAGTYSVTVTEGGCSSVCSKNIIMSQPPICTITGGDLFCNGQSTQLCTPFLTNATYLWSTGATTNCINVNATGTYFVTVTEGGGCQSVCSKTITSQLLPNCEITGNCNLCTAQTTQLCVLAGASAYLWSTGATTSCITTNTAGEYSVTVTNANGCSSVCKRTVVINDIPICTLNGFDTICQGQTKQLCVPMGALTYLWSTGATTNCITVNATGFYCVTITNSSGCSSVCSQTITVLPAIVLTTTVVNATCLTLGSITVTANGKPPFRYLWSSGQTTATINNLFAGTYTVTLTDANGCIGTKTVLITSPNLQCDITIIQQMSGQNTNDAKAQVVGSLGLAPYTYLWSNGSTGQTATGLGATTYSVTVTDANGCKSVCSVIIPNNVCDNVINAGQICCSQTICADSELQPIYESLPASGGAASEVLEYLWMYSYEGSRLGWTTIAGATGKNLPISLIPAILRPIHIIRCVRRANCSDYQETNTITITPRAFANIVSVRNTCINEDTYFTAEENPVGATYNWTFRGATIGSSFNQTQTVQFTSYGLHEVILIVTSFGCQKTKIMSVNVMNCQDVYGNFMGFTATVNHKEALLNWTTRDEQKPSMYMIEKSLDNVNFSIIDAVASQNGANNFYTYTDKTPKAGRTYYRIYQMSPSNETLTVSKTEKIMIDETDKSIITYPNPVGSTLFVEVLAENTEGVLEVYDVLGRVVKTKNFVKDQVRYELEVGDLVSGNYIIRVRFSDGKSVATKILKF